MNAHETHLGKILEGIKQYMVPLFQRPYTWDESRWKVLWADLVELCEDEQGTELAKPHFLGSIVTVPTRSVPEGVTKFVLIDGQQRLTTLQVLLAALRDLSRELPGQLAERLDKSYLVNQFEEGLDHYKLLPTQTNEVLQATLETVRETSPDTFDGIVEQFPRLLGIDAGRFRSPRPLGTNLHFETNLSAESIARYCQQFVVAAGYSTSDWAVEAK